MSLDPENLNYWERPPNEPVRQADWLDPDPLTRGMLLADRIQFYVDKVDMIRPFDQSLLKPASYGVTLGPFYQINGEHRVLTSPNPTLVIPPNSIAFVSMGERLRIPHYIAVRFNLSIEYIYQGLLLGTGPQVDPGFQGVLSCPLHNISNLPIRITMGDHFATIDFTKTTPLAEQSSELLASFENEDGLYEHAKELVGYAGHTHRFFRQDKRWLRPIIDYEAGKRKVSSSVDSLAKKVKQAQWFSYGAAVAVIALAVGLITLVFTLSQNWSTELDRARTEIDRLRGEIVSPAPSPAGQPVLPTPPRSGP